MGARAQGIGSLIKRGVLIKWEKEGAGDERFATTDAGQQRVYGSEQRRDENLRCAPSKNQRKARTSQLLDWVIFSTLSDCLGEQIEN